MDNPLFPYVNQFTQKERNSLASEYIKKLRIDCGYKQNYVADILGISQSTYSSYEVGRNEIPSEILVRLSFLYDKTTDELLQKFNFNLDIAKSKNLLTDLDSIIDELKKDLPNAPEANKELASEILNFMENINNISKMNISNLENEQKK